MGVFLLMWCIFSEYLLTKNPLRDCSWIVTAIFGDINAACVIGDSIASNAKLLEFGPIKISKWSEENEGQWSDGNASKSCLLLIIDNMVSSRVNLKFIENSKKNPKKTLGAAINKKNNFAAAKILIKMGFKEFDKKDRFFPWSEKQQLLFLKKLATGCLMFRPKHIIVTLRQDDNVLLVTKMSVGGS